MTKWGRKETAEYIVNHGKVFRGARVSRVTERAFQALLRLLRASRVYTASKAARDLQDGRRCTVLKQIITSSRATERRRDRVSRMDVLIANARHLRRGAHRTVRVSNSMPSAARRHRARRPVRAVRRPNAPRKTSPAWRSKGRGVRRQHGLPVTSHAEKRRA